ASNTGTVAVINANNLTSGKGLLVSSTGSGTTPVGNVFGVSSASTGDFTAGAVSWVVSASCREHAGNGFEVDDSTVSGKASVIKAASATSGTAVEVNANAASNTGTVAVINANNLTSGKGLLVSSTGSGTTPVGNVFAVSSSSTGALTSGAVN